MVKQTEAEKLINIGYKILDGGIIIGKRGYYLKLHKGTGGYVQLNTGRAESQVTYLVHRLVAQLYVPNPDNLPEVNHDNGIKDCNWSWNLKWCTRPQNIQHGFDTGLITPPWKGKTGSKHFASKGTKQLRISDNVLIGEFGSTLEAERVTGISAKHIQDVCRGKGISAGGFKWEYDQQSK
jgi:hypothetical protein